MAAPFDQSLSQGACQAEELPEVVQSPREASKEQRGGGHDCEFVERPQEIQADCPICLLVLQEPHQATCCGYSYCQACIERVQSNRKPCPTCNATDFSVFPNKGLKRSLYAFRVYCSRKKEGCQWVGELGGLEKHVNGSPIFGEQLLGCEFTEVECCHCCEFFQRRFITGHQNSECLRRPFSCDYCGNYGADYENVTTKHWPTCGFYPVPCPNGCGMHPERQNVEQHVDNECSLTELDCTFCYAGCKVRLRRREMTAHLTENLAVHMSLLAIHNEKIISEKDRQITALTQTLQEKLEENRQKIDHLERENEAMKRDIIKMKKENEMLKAPALPLDFVMVDFERYKCKNETWYSRPFYTHPQGYKMCLKMIPDLHDKGTKIYIGACLMRGEFDDYLKWPFTGSITINVVNQLKDEQHLVITAPFHECPDKRVTTRDKAEKGYGEDIYYTTLKHNPATSCCYLKDDSLHLRVTEITNTLWVARLEKQCLGIQASICIPPIEFTMTGFAEYQEKNNWWDSPSFYTHPQGYKMQLRVYANGIDDGAGTHTSLYVCIQQGEFDDHLKWPLRGDITMQLLNQLDDKDHYEGTISFDGECAVGVITGEETPNEWGFDDFISHQQLTYNQTTNCQFLKHDSLHFRVVKVKLKD